MKMKNIPKPYFKNPCSCNPMEHLQNSCLTNKPLASTSQVWMVHLQNKHDYEELLFESTQNLNLYDLTRLQQRCKIIVPSFSLLPTPKCLFHSFEWPPYTGRLNDHHKDPLESTHTTMTLVITASPLTQLFIKLTPLDQIQTIELTTHACYRCNLKSANGIGVLLPNKRH